ncbi:MAG: glycosyltransferase family 2 protein [Planctomycetes bacterium]|nr:glycosyltransferase family 2 protein [Planctomycetota bacterium]
MSEMVVQPDFTVVIPCYNSASTIAEVISRVTEFFDAAGHPFEIVCVDDASPDDVADVILKIRERDKRVCLIRHHRNYGQHRSVLTGMRYVRGKFAVTMDDDLQNPPEEIQKLIDGIGDADVAIGMPENKQHASYRNLGSNLVNGIVKLAFKPPPGYGASSFRLIRRTVVDQMANMRTVYPHLGSIILSVTRRIVQVDVRHEPRRVGRSNYNVRKLISLAGNLLINYTKLPMRVMTLTGLATAFLALAFSVYIIVLKVVEQQHYDAGWPSVIVAIAFFGGLNLVSLSVIGEYIIRLLSETSGASQVVLRAEHFGDDSEDPHGAS